MKKLAIIGANGMLGSDLVKYLGPQFSVTPIIRETYSKYIDTEFDIVLNANGNSRRFWANKNPQEDFIASTVSVYKSIFDFPSDIYIYISSPDVYENSTESKYTKENTKIDPKNLQPYGFNKYLSEQIVKRYTKEYLILRSSMILGSKLKKGPFYDIESGNALYITLQSQLQLITTRAVADVIETLLKNFVESDTINIGGIGSFELAKIRKYLDLEPQISPDAHTQIYEMSVEKLRRLYLQLKTSEEYLQEFLKEDLEK